METINLPVSCSVYGYLALNVLSLGALLVAIGMAVHQYRGMRSEADEIEKHLDSVTRPIVKPVMGLGWALAMAIWSFLIIGLAVALVYVLSSPFLFFCAVTVSSDGVLLERQLVSPVQVSRSEISDVILRKRYPASDWSIQIRTGAGKVYTSRSSHGYEDSKKMEEAYKKLKRALGAATRSAN